MYDGYNLSMLYCQFLQKLTPNEYQTGGLAPSAPVRDPPLNIVYMSSSDYCMIKIFAGTDLCHFKCSTRSLAHVI